MCERYLVSQGKGMLHWAVAIAVKGLEENENAMCQGSLASQGEVVLH